jgi:hypothetical protein
MSKVREVVQHGANAATSSGDLPAPGARHFVQLDEPEQVARLNFGHARGPSAWHRDRFPSGRFGMEASNANAGKEWSGTEIQDLQHCLKIGMSEQEIAEFLARTVAEVREKSGAIWGRFQNRRERKKP